jgi:putative ABC transport system permease protein
MWIVGESFFLGLLGGIGGLLLAWPLINLGFSRFIEENMGGFFPYFRLETANMILGLALATLLGVAASTIPAWRASKIRVVDAIRRVA